MKKNQKNTLYGAALSVVTVAVALLILESIFSYRYSNSIAKLESERKGRELCTMTSDNTELVYSGAPNKCGRNSRGNKEYDYPYEKLTDDFRVIVIGDSVASGYGIPLEDSFGKILEDGLNKQLTNNNQKVEVISLAQNGYSTSQEMVLLNEEALKYSPDLIIWSYVLNDPGHPVYHDGSGQLVQYHYTPRSHLLHFVRKKIFQIQENTRRRDCPRQEHHALLHCVYEKDIKENIEAIAAFSIQHEIPLIFLIHPIFEQGGSFDAYSLANIHEELANAVVDAGLSFIDLSENYKEYSAEELALPIPTGVDPWHPNKLGHKIAAQALIAHIASMNDFINAFKTGARFLRVRMSIANRSF